MIMRLFSVILFSVISFSGIAQDAVFSMPGSATAYVNPALIDHDKMGSFRMTYRLQWPKLDGGYSQYYTEYSHFIRKAHGYITAYGLYENNYVLTTQNYFLNYTQSIAFGKKVVLRPTIGVGMYIKKIDWDVLSFGDMIDPRAGFIYNSNDINTGGKASGIDFRTGFALNAYDFAVGFSVTHLTQPDQSLTKGRSPIPLHFAFQLAYSGELILNREVVMRFSPFVCYDAQSTAQTLQLGSYIDLKNKLRFGLGLRLKDAVHFVMGYNHEYFSVNFGYDYTISGLKGITGGSYEMNLGVRILKPPVRPDFLHMKSPFM
jgi:type IX secretion system PorP/SprF family membrane protein